ncbi:hypothetical protein [Actinacidiphila soli]|uniref:hypothetical protein n=1 Tax=Actinacidiphila soli TaxID=2487275 RepID=UPI000FCA98F4|nr:hypothetical protein [Actinacidiphila soli]
MKQLLSRVRYEVLPAKSTEDKVLAHVPRDVVITVTASPVKGPKIGVGESTRFLAKHASWFVRLATPGGYSPERLLTRTAPALAAPSAAVAGLHVFTFNQIAETERWRRDMLARAGS